jgi:hypothetical protein
MRVLPHPRVGYVLRMSNRSHHSRKAPWRYYRKQFGTYLCLRNRYKGTDIGSIAKSTGEFVRFYNPRTDHWFEHFRFVSFEIQPLTPVGETTSTILRFNDPDRILEREAIGDT